MFRRFCQAIVGLLFWCGSLGALAASVPADFSTVIVPVAGQSPAELHSALVEAFSRVLIKISGNSGITAVPEIQQQLSSAERFVQKYNYIDSSVQVTFDQRALIALLVKTQQPLWLSARPATLIWLSPIPNANPAPLTVLQQAAVLRAIPIEFPNPGPATAQEASLDQAALEKLAAQYQKPAILSGQLTQAADQTWSADWFFVWRGQSWQWRNSGRYEVVLQAGIDKIADIMGGQLAVNLDQQAGNTLWVAVLGVNNLNDYHSALAALKQLPPVLGVEVKDVGSHGILVQVSILGQGTGALKEALKNSGRFQPASSKDAANPDVLNYRWTP